MKCKRLCAWLLSLVMMFSLLPVSAAAADIPDAYKPTIKWTKDWADRDHSLTVEVINEGTSLGTISEQKKHLSATVKLEKDGVEVYDHEASGGTYSRNTAKLFTFIGTTGFLKLYTRSKAGHTVTVNYVYTDDESKNGSKSENVKYAEEKSFGKLEKDYGYEITVSSDDVKYEVNSLNELWVTGGAEDSEITVTYTPKDVIYIDQYYDNGKLWVKWTRNNIKVNGPELLKGAAEAAVIEGEDLTDAVEDYRFLTVNGVTYDFSFASLVPVKGNTLTPITDVWYDRDKGTWYYSHTDRKGVLFGLGDKVPVVNRGCVNFCYNTPHSEKSKYHDWKWVHVDGTEEAASKHQQVCSICGKKGQTEACDFDAVTTGTTTTYTCKDCKYTYDDYTLTYNANGGKWSAALSGYTMNEGNTTATIKGLASSTKVGAAPAPANGNMAFKGWSSSTDAKDIVVKLALSPTVGNLMHDYDIDKDNTVTFYAIWEDSGEQPELTYTIRQHFMRNDGPKGEDGAVNYIELGQAAKGTMISTLINDLEKGWKFGSPSQTYLYDNRKTKVNDASDVAATSKLETSGTVIDLYYYLDENEDKIPDYTQIFISYQSGNLLYGTVMPEKKVVITLNDSNKNSVIVTDDAQGGTAKPRENYAFVKWVKGSDGNAAAYSKSTTLTPTITDPIGGTTYVFTAFFKPAGQDMGTLNVTKVMTGKNLADLPDDFALLVKNAQDVTVATLMLHGDNNKTVYVSDDGHWSLDLTPGDYTIEEVSADIDGYDLTTTYTQKQNTVSEGATTSVTVTNSYMERGADLVDDAITIYHKVSDRSDWHGGNAYADASAHQAGRTPTISYKAELDLSEMKLQRNNQTASIIDAYGEKPWENLVKAVQTARGSLAMFSGSKIVLHVQLDKQLSTADIQNQLKLNNITVTSDWFELSKAGNPVVYDENAQSLTITCVPKNTANGYSSKITLSGLNDLSLTSILSSGETRALAASGYITGSILISVPTVKVNAVTVETEDLVDAVQHGNGELYLNESIPLVLGSKTATNTAKLYWKEIKDNDDDDDDKYFFAIQKVDAQDGHALNGAKFELYQLDKNDRIKNRRVVETRQQSSKNGIALFGVDNKNSYDGIWYYAEVSAPEGYVLDNTEHKIKATDFFDSLSTAVKYADTVRNYRGTTPDLLNDSDHFAYVIGYMDGNVRPYGLISRAETTTIFFRLLKDSVRDGNLLTSNTYTDVADDYWANIAISTMTGLGIVQGRSADTFDPKAPITRAQFAAICARFDTGRSNGEQTFTDIKGHWAEKYIERAAELGWIKGFEDGTFRPDTYITRAQAMTMINRVLNRIPEEESDLLPGMNVWPDCNPGDWFYLAVQEATNSHDFEHKAGNYETWTKLMKNPNWTRYEN